MEYVQEACRWVDAGSIQGLGFLYEACSTEAYDVSGDGKIIVGTSGSSIGLQAFLWEEENEMQNLNELLPNEYGLDISGWILQKATGISDDGTKIVGYGINPDGFTEGWIASIPEPCTLVLLSFGGLACLKRRWK